MSDTRAMLPTFSRGTGRVAFLREFLAKPNVVGSILPSSRHLAWALMGPFLERTGPASILEIGAGTGAVTAHLGSQLGPEDLLTICEIQPGLVEHLRKHVLTRGSLAGAFEAGRIRLCQGPVQQIDRRERYDYIICGLPFTAFAADEVRAVFDVVRAVVAPGGVFSYFEYIGLRRLRTGLSGRASRRRMSEVSSVLDAHIAQFEFRRVPVLRNFPPAYARHWRFVNDDGCKPAR